MKLKCTINGNEYDIVQGCTFAEEYNETLDSGTIIIDHIPQIDDLRPYDDVFIYSGTFNGYGYENPVTKEIGAYSTQDTEHGVSTFYISDDIYNGEILDSDFVLRFVINGTNIECRYEFEEIDGTSFRLARVDAISSCPATMRFESDGQGESSYIYTGLADFLKSNVTVASSTTPTMPTFYRHLLVDQFSEEVINLKDGIYKYKIELFSETKRLETVQLPNISITQPLNINKKISVWEYINRFVKMYSPVFKMATNKTSKVWNYQRKYAVDTNLEQVFGNVYSPDFTLNNPNLRDVLAQLMLTKDMIPYVKDDVIYGMDITARHGTFDADTRKVNYITGSRSSDNHADNLRRTYNNALSQENSCRMVEYMGLRNSDDALMTIDNMRLETRYPIYKINKVYACYYKKCDVYEDLVKKGTKVFLCKQDITKLVKLNTERSLLLQDWNDFEDNPPTSIDEMAQYKLCTVGYDIGGKHITGFGTKYTYPVGWWDISKTYIENILTKVDEFTPYGIYQRGFFSRAKGQIGENEYIDFDNNFFNRVVNPFTNNSLFFKSVFFMVDYDAFYNGSVVHSKDDGRDDITMNDNSSSSLTLLEQDGLFQKEKINRFGNKAIQINARYDDIDDLQELGSVYGDDVIIYHREYEVFDNLVRAVYYGTKDYVLKNYFTSVYAKHRPYNLMSYGESVTRSENKKMMVLLSKDKCIYENENRQFEFESFGDGNNFIAKVISFLKPTSKPLTIDYFADEDKENYGALTNEDGDAFLSDVNAFASGNSLCFNIQAFDNVSGGVYIKEKEPTVDASVQGDFTGSVQGWLMSVDDEETGANRYMSVEVAHFNKDDVFLDNQLFDDSDDAKAVWNNTISQMPLITAGFGAGTKSNIIKGDYEVNKDNKEILDFTLQIEPISQSGDVLFSQWLMKLSDMLSTYRKFEKDTPVEDTFGFDTEQNAVYNTFVTAEGYNAPYMSLYFDNTVYEDLVGTIPVDTTFSFNINAGVIGVTKYEFRAKFISELTSDSLLVTGEQRATVRGLFQTNEYVEERSIRLFKQTTVGNWGVPNTKDLFANINVTSSNIYDWASYESRIRINGDVKGFGDFACKCEEEYFGTDNLLTQSIVQELVLSLSGGTETKSYKKNLFVVTGDTPMSKEIVYNEYAYGDIAFTPENTPVSDVFSIEVDESGREYIKVATSEKTAQLWYLDNVTYSRSALGVWTADTSRASYKFVFGVNLTDAERSQGYAKVYLSLVSNRDERVFDENHNPVGKVKNYAENGTNYGTKQYYVAKPIIL